MPNEGLPEFREWSIGAVKLLQGVVYADDIRAWNIILSSSRQVLENYFARLGLLLVVDEPEGLAYLRQLEEDELPEGYDALPKLVRRIPLGYNATLLCVLLRDNLRRFEEEDLNNERCVVEPANIFEEWRTFFPIQQDEIKQRRELSAAFSKLEDLGFIRKISDDPETWEIRRILKARLPVTELDNLKAQLLAATQRRSANNAPNTFNE